MKSNSTPLSKYWISLILFFNIQTNLFPQLNQDQTFPRIALKNTELRPFHCYSTNRDYLLYIAYPESYNSNIEKIYPVVYMTDPYWNFNSMYVVGDKLMLEKMVPEYILVGIGYDGDSVDYMIERCFELTPSKDELYFPEKPIKFGGARKFLSGLKNEIIPYVEQNLRVDTTFRVLSGASLGGLFSLYSMYEEQTLFNGIIAVSPFLAWDRDWMIKKESDVRFNSWKNDSSEFKIPTRLSLSIAEKDLVLCIYSTKAFYSIIETLDYVEHGHEFRTIKDEGHASMTAEAFIKSLRFIFNYRTDSVPIK